MKLLDNLRNFNPRWVINLVVIAVVAVNISQMRFCRNEIITGEVASHYTYLPAFFYENDLSFSFLNDGEQSGEKNDRYETELSGTAGMAISYLPFFGLAHICAKLLDYPADGFSAPYQFAVQFSSLVYYVIGLIFLAKLLRLHFPGFISSLTMLCLSFATNVFFYLTEGGGMPHAVSFLLAILFIYQTVSWYQMRTIAAAAQLGLLLGALWLVEPINLLFVLVFLLYDIRRWSKVKARMKLFMIKPLHLLTIVVCCFLVMLPQLILWQWSQRGLFSGQQVHYFSERNFLELLFGGSRGWLFYSPIMVLAIAGFFLLKAGLRMYAWAIPVFFLVYLYFAFTWCFKWYGGSYGMGVLIDIYPLLSLPLAAFLYKLRRLGGWYRRALYFTVMLLTALNIYQVIRTDHDPLNKDNRLCKAAVVHEHTALICGQVKPGMHA